MDPLPETGKCDAIPNSWIDRRASDNHTNFELNLKVGMTGTECKDEEGAMDGSQDKLGIISRR
jgi:hypothetical protein